MRTSGIAILPIGEIDRGRWNELLVTDPTSTAFQTSEWLACLQATYPAWEVGAIVARDGEAIVAAIPFVRRRVSGIVLVESMPFGGRGGLIRTDRAFEGTPLVRGFFGLGRAPLSIVRLIGTSGLTEGSPLGRTAIRTAAVVDLSAGYDVIAARYQRNVRKNLRRARDLGVEVRPVGDRASVETFMNLADYAYRLHDQALPYPLALYEAIAQQLVPAGRAIFELAYKDGEAVAGSLHLVGAHELFNWLTPAYRERQDLRANTLLIDAAIRYGIAAGLPTYNLGASQDHEGLERFKSSWGGHDTEYLAIETVSPPVALARRARAVVRAVVARRAVRP
jgi:hypothetical protein